MLRLGNTEEVGNALRVLEGIDLEALLGGESAEDSDVDVNVDVEGNRDGGVSDEGGVDLKAGSSTEKGPKRRKAPQPLKISLKGLQSMKNPSSTTVLYIPPLDADGHLRKFCEGIRGVFKEKELLVNPEQQLLLHATVVNTVYVMGRHKDEGARENGVWQKNGKLFIDAKAFLERWKDVEWISDVRVESVGLWKMGDVPVKVEGEDGVEYDDRVYLVEGDVKLPR